MNPKWVLDGYDEIRLRIYRRLRRRDWSPTRAEDMAAEATQEAIRRNLDRTHESRAHYVNSTTQIAWNYVLDEVRKQKRSALVTDPPHPESSAPGPAADIEACLAEMDSQLREIFVRRFMNEERVEDIATTTGESMRTVFRRLEAARNILQACMTRKGW
jgi:DNA-directed RNA polymerase specialized sigma24 family protein